MEVSGPKAHKDRLTLIMCGNAEGFLLKPALIYKSRNPRALKNKDKNSLPVHWMHNQKSWITKQLSSDWFHECFIPQVKSYLAGKPLEFKVLLLMDNAGGHAQDLEYAGVRVEFLPPNTTSLIQPMDQGVIRAFKALYTRSVLQHLVRGMDVEECFSMKEYWRSFTIAVCLEMIQGALSGMKAETVKASWKKLWPDLVEVDSTNAPQTVCESVIDESVQLAQRLGGPGFSNMSSGDLDEFLETQKCFLSDEDILEVSEHLGVDEDREGEADRVSTEQVVDEGLTSERLSQLLRSTEELKQMIDRWDPEMSRGLRGRNALDSAVEPYRLLPAEVKRQYSQLPITMFLSQHSKDPTSSSRPHLSGIIELD
ncbi:tigger transposable element-derived protein 1-like [Galendromus occidentalis]|uniref:Tigger transposable element-derived protein 1-like n=1 Tax=Galendromus occidentalis TaxID=34638 RepID=A0AAJ6QSD7_9ACAR|nr:tigger transposable element-derived protein 1-like [Galendromus occidentalis]